MNNLYILHQGGESPAYYGPNEDYIGNEQEAPFSFSEIKHLNKPPMAQKLPQILEFTTTDEKLLGTVHFAKISRFELISQELVDIIGLFGTPNWNLIPTRFFNSNNQQVQDGRFHGLFFNEHCDCFDYENSEYIPQDFSHVPKERITDRRRKQDNTIKRAKLIEPEGGFPPIFRVLADSRHLLVTQDVCEAIEREKCDKGISLYPIGENWRASPRTK